MSKEQELQKLENEIIKLYTTLIILADNEYLGKSELINLLDRYLPDFSELINQLDHGGDKDDDENENRPDPSAIEGLTSIYGKLKSASSRLRSSAYFVPRGLRSHNLVAFVRLIRPLLQLLEEMNSRVQMAIGSSSDGSLNDLMKVLSSFTGERSYRGGRRPGPLQGSDVRQHGDDFGVPREASDRISVAVYLDTDSVELQANAIAAVERLVYVLGYGQDSEARTEAGSIFKAWWAKVLQGLTSSDVQDRLARVEAYAESYLGERISAINSNEAAALKEVVTAISDIPNASLRVGSILIVKYTGRDGVVVLLSRPLSVLEIRVLERYPEIQQDPLKVLELLGNALSMDHDDEEPYDDRDAPPEIGA